MAEMLLINPRRRRRATKAKRTKARRRNPVKMLRKLPSVARAANPRRRRRNPVTLRARSRRRRNPIGVGGVTVKSFVSMLQDAAVGGAGAIGVDLLWARVNPMLPPMMQSVPGSLNVGTVVKAFATAVLGQVLGKATKGLSRKAASGSLAVQARDAIVTVLPAGMTLGYSSPASITQGTQRVGPIRTGINGRVGAYMKPGATPLLNGTGAYLRPGATPLLNRFAPARLREGGAVR